jgi:molybdenum cofactor synthesis domain-containing protein
MHNLQPTAALLIIGNEILSGRTQDANLNYLAKTLGKLGVRLVECRVVSDNENAIIEAVQSLSGRNDYVFTSGGIGPTHDDITTATIAKAFGKKLLRHPEAEARLRKHYKPEDINAARLKMADIPEGAELIDNPVSAAPGFILENVYVMAGVPRIMQAMLDGVSARIKGGAVTLSRTISATVTEGYIAAELTAIQEANPNVEIGSYPFIRDGKLGVSLVCRSTDVAALDKVAQELRALISKHNAQILEDN